MLNSLILKAYAQSILTPEEEADLMGAARKGSASARDALIMAHIRIAYSAAVDLKGYGFPVEDLFQQGILGLHHALEKYDEKHGVRFGRYAKSWVRGSMTRYIIENWSLLNVETRVYRKMFFALRRHQLELSGFGVDVTSLEPSLTPDQRAELAALAPIIVSGEKSLNQPVKSEEPSGMTLLDVLADEAGEAQDIIAKMSRDELMGMVRTALEGLSDLQKRVIMERYLGEDERSFVDLARELDISADRVRRAEKSALEAIKQSLMRDLGTDDLSEVT